MCKKQTKRSNYTVESTEDYYRVSIYIPYLDSIINSLNVRFSSSTEIPFLLNDLSPKRIIVMSRTEYKSNIDKLNAMYCIDNFVIEAMMWYDMWAGKDDIKFQLVYTTFHIPNIYRQYVMLLIYY